MENKQDKEFSSGLIFKSAMKGILGVVGFILGCFLLVIIFVNLSRPSPESSTNVNTKTVLETSKEITYLEVKDTTVKKYANSAIGELDYLVETMAKFEYKRSKILGYLEKFGDKYEDADFNYIDELINDIPSEYSKALNYLESCKTYIVQTDGSTKYYDDCKQTLDNGSVCWTVVKSAKLKLGIE